MKTYPRFQIGTCIYQTNSLTTVSVPSYTFKSTPFRNPHIGILLSEVYLLTNMFGTTPKRPVSTRKYPYCMATCILASHCFASLDSLSMTNGLTLASFQRFLASRRADAVEVGDAMASSQDSILGGPSYFRCKGVGENDLNWQEVRMSPVHSWMLTHLHHRTGILVLFPACHTSSQ